MEEVKDVAAPDSAVTETKEAPVVEVTKSMDAAPVGEAGEVPPFTPNYKLSVMDEEKEIDEMFRPLMKDPDTEKKVREIFERAYGHEYLKPKYEDIKKRLPEVEGEYKSFRSGVENIVGLRDKDFWGFIEAVGLDKQTVAKQVLDEVKRLELPEEQKQIYDELDKTRREKLNLERQFQEEQWRNQERSVLERTYQLDTVLQKPEITAYAKAYDTSRRKPGAFREEVVRQGIAEWHVSQKDLSPEQAVQDVISRLGEHYKGGVAAPQTLTPGAEDKPLPVIPRVSGKSMSPTGKAPRSIEDLKKMAADLSR